VEEFDLQVDLNWNDKWRKISLTNKEKRKRNLTINVILYTIYKEEYVISNVTYYTSLY